MPGAVKLFIRSLGRRQWQLLAVAWLVTLAFGCWAWYLEYQLLVDLGEAESARTASDILYNALGLFTLNSAGAVYPLVWQLEVARFLAPLVAAFTAVKTLGLVLTAQAFRFRQRFARDHVVVCGLGQRGLRLGMELRKRGTRVVVIEHDQADALLDTCRQADIDVITADATERHVLQLARVDTASHVVAVCGQDAVNAEIAAETAALTSTRRGAPLHCLVHIVDAQLWRLLRERELGDDPATPFRLEFFNLFESGARAILREFPPFPEEAEEDAAAPHVLIVGLGRLGEHIALRMAWEWHRRLRRGGAPLTMSVLDSAARERCQALADRYPQLAKSCDLRPVELDACSPAFERCEFLLDDQDKCCVTDVYVCLDDDTRALSAALTLHRQTRERGVPIVVRLDGGRGLAELLGGRTASAAEFSDIHSFSLLDATCQADLVLRGTHESLARGVHDLYVAEQAKAGHTRDDNPLVVPWDELPPDIKESNRRAADHIRVMLTAAGYSIAPLEDWDADLFRFSISEVETMGDLEHERWIRERQSGGWKYAPGARSNEAKTSPYLVPWDQLPEDVKDYDRATVRRVPALLAEVGLQVRHRGGDYPATLRIGVVGHRTIDEPEAVAREVRRALSEIQAREARDGDRREPTRLQVLSALAEGADRLAARALLEEPGSALIAVLPFEKEDYATDFETAESRAEFYDLLEIAQKVEVVGPTPSRVEGYERAGRLIVDTSDVMLAMWDGGPSRGRGGTAEVIEYARATNVPVFWIRTNRGSVALTRL